MRQWQVTRQQPLVDGWFVFSSFPLRFGNSGCHWARVPYLMATVDGPDGTGSTSCSPFSVWCGEAVCGRSSAIETADARQTNGRSSLYDLWLSFEPLHACVVPDGDDW